MVLSSREQLMRKFGMAIDDDVIEDVLRHGTADIGEKIPNNHRAQALVFRGRQRPENDPVNHFQRGRAGRPRNWGQSPQQAFCKMYSLCIAYHYTKAEAIKHT